MTVRSGLVLLTIALLVCCWFCAAQTGPTGARGPTGATGPVGVTGPTGGVAAASDGSGGGVGLAAILVLVIVVIIFGLNWRLGKTDEGIRQIRDETRTAIEQMRDELALLRAADQTRMLAEWNRMAPGTPPPFAPDIRNLNPVQAAQGTQIEINGDNFSRDCVVWFGSKKAQITGRPSTRQILVNAPDSPAGPVSVCVQTPSGLISVPQTFTYI
jgi:hypothetical protein